MKLTLKRFAYSDKSTIGIFFVDQLFKAFTLEDKKRDSKIKGITCIKAGIYEIKLNTTGAKNLIYSKKYPDHIGMLELQNVPEFKYVYIHIGNFPHDTEGCILVGMDYYVGKDMINSSAIAYKSLYPIISKAIASGVRVEIEIIDM